MKLNLEKISYTLDGNRKIQVIFVGRDQHPKVTEVFEMPTANLIEMRPNGWQAIVDNFKSCTESN